MIRPFFSVALVSLALAAVACGGTDDPQPSSSTSSNSPQDDSDDSNGSTASGEQSEGSDESEDDSADSSLGPQCEVYFACCEEIVDDHPQLAASCDQTKSQIDAAEEKGASTSSYESACESALDAARSAGYCD